MEFNLAWHLNGYQVKPTMDFGELTWMYQRLHAQIERENEKTDSFNSQMRGKMN